MPTIELSQWPYRWRCSNGGRKRCRAKAPYIVQWEYRSHVRKLLVISLRYACVDHARTYAKRHGLVVPGDEEAIGLVRLSPGK